MVGLRQEDPVARADRLVRISQVCEWVGAGAADAPGERSVKIHCPFGALWHSDGGVERAMRVYPATNSAHCFACQRSWRPTTLAAAAWGVTRRRAARRLLERSGAPATMTWERACRPPGRPLETTGLALALKEYMERLQPGVSERGSRDDDHRALSVYDDYLALLDVVRSPADARRWLGAAKRTLRRVILSSDNSMEANQ